MKLSPKNQMFTKCSLQIFFPRDTSIPHFLLWHSSTRSFSRWLGHNFCGFSPYPTAKTLWPCSLKKILVSNFPLSTFWMWYMIFFRKKWSSLNPANPIQQKGGHAAALLLMLPAVLRLRFGTPFGIFTPLFLFYHFCLSLGVQFNGITFWYHPPVLSIPCHTSHAALC